MLTLLTYSLRLNSELSASSDPHGVTGAGCAHHMLILQAVPHVFGYPKPEFFGDDECPTDTHKSKTYLTF